MLIGLPKGKGNCLDSNIMALTNDWYLAKVTKEKTLFEYWKYGQNQGCYQSLWLYKVGIDIFHDL